VRSPLDEPGVEIDEGDYILAVNHETFPDDLPFEASLENMAGQPVLLTVNDRPSMKGAREVVVTPIAGEGAVLYADWVRRNREHVAEKSGGKIGYIHIPDMDARGLVAFDRWFYPQLDREGMIVDVRWNGGGYVSQLILARLQRRIISWDRVRWGAVLPYPARVLNGPFVVLVNEGAGSDGDIFPEAIQLAGLAPVIGTRSWGGVVGIFGARSLVDGGAVTHPESAWWDARRGWGLEGRGVEPDIEVVNLPQDLARGIDAQLERGIEEVLRLHKRHPPLEPEFGPGPDRSRRAYQRER
jgi:tricorn protease